MARLTLEISDELMASLKKLAAADDRSVSSFVRLCVMKVANNATTSHNKSASPQPPAQSKPSTVQATNPPSPKPKAVDDEVDLDGIDFDD